MSPRKTVLKTIIENNGVLITNFIVIVTYGIVSLIVFHYVNIENPHPIVDELFHLEQGINYCHHNFSYYNPKITTPPGIYMVAAATLGFINKCSTYYLRLLNLVFSVINLILMKKIMNSKTIRTNSAMAKYFYEDCELASALNIALLPPLYFFNNLYYTETLSLTTILAMLYFAKHKRYFFVIIFALLSLLMRQTSIIWILLVYGENLLQLVIQCTRTRSHKKRKYAWRDLKSALFNAIKLKFNFRNLSKSEIIYMFTLTGIIFMFISFVYVNGSLVLGDKEAHKPQMHVTQIFYYSIFVLIFSFPYIIKQFVSFVDFLKFHSVIFFLLFFIFSLIVHHFTLVHPYLLADNRHYTFYIWNRFYGKYYVFRYLMVIVYFFSLFGIVKNLLNRTSITFWLPFIIGTCTLLTVQELIDVRYFIIPFVIMRMSTNCYDRTKLLLEFLFNVFCNIVTFHIFFNKEIQWKDFDYVQRLIW